MLSRDELQRSFSAALPIMLGYVAIGLPCGILAVSIGLDALQVFLLSLLFYSGAGQFMIPNLFMAGASIPSIITSISLVNTRQLLYSASLAPFQEAKNKLLSFLFAATVTDESYGVNIARFSEGSWSVANATMVNLFSQSSWIVSNVIGVFIGQALSVPLGIASYAMTAIFICLLCTQKFSFPNIVAALVSMLGIVLCKTFQLNDPAILISASLGVIVAIVVGKRRKT